ncbi:MAG: class I SAM-dependent methyltransferase [Propionibacteriaceae bacterium]|nr:class I SAM-dependent methyltransferase [Propionibacteriaceae bacterium]
MTGHRPEPWGVYATTDFWDDPHISGQMLAHHLDPDTAAASRTHAFMDASADWLCRVLALGPGSRVLDLGCGPGLYAERLARRGATVLGVDASRRSLAHARAVAAAEGLAATYVHGNYLDTPLGEGHDAAILIYEDYCVLSPAQRAVVLMRVRDALRPGGQFVFDVTAAPRFATVAEGRQEDLGERTEFWAERPYTGTRHIWTYPDLRLVLNHYVITKDGHTRQFWDWMQCLTPAEATAEVEAAGFRVIEVTGDVAGAPFDADAPTFAVRVAVT